MPLEGCFEEVSGIPLFMPNFADFWLWRVIWGVIWRVTHKLTFEEVSGIPLFMCDFADFWH
ncbi:hypothetical protein EEL42_13435 [Muribaculaceae bacterium Isolate-100 (HZI)]|nr:hypothetical protein EEL42_13435 [Muribaculaceae bacterium Isolate-100 (HZI)]